DPPATSTYYGRDHVLSAGARRVVRFGGWARARGGDPRRRSGVRRDRGPAAGPQRLRPGHAAGAGGRPAVRVRTRGAGAGAHRRRRGELLLRDGPAGPGRTPARGAGGGGRRV